MGTGGVVGGLLFDATGNYDWSFGFAAGVGVINLIILGLFFVRIRSQGELSPATA
jgi:hypothetical protein